LDTFQRRRRNERCIIGGLFELDFGTVDGRRPGVGRILGSRRERMLEAVEGLVDIARHGKVASAGRIIPGKRDAGK
jgi:hypothetical protein